MWLLEHNQRPGSNTSETLIRFLQWFLNISTQATQDCFRFPFITKSWRIRFARTSIALVSLWKSEPVCSTRWNVVFRWSACRAYRILLWESIRACNNTLKKTIIQNPDKIDHLQWLLYVRLKVCELNQYVSSTNPWTNATSTRRTRYQTEYILL